MMYSSGMPVLYIVGMFQIFVTYWVDKLLFLRFYKTPPRYGIGMSSVVRKSMEYAVILHILFGIYMFSNSQILTYSMNTDFG
jgi:hypothetical protein